MKKNYFIFLIHLFTSNFFFSQKSETENLVNTFYKEFVPTNFQYFNLLDKSFIPDFDVYSLNEAIEDSNMQKEIPFFKKEDFLVSGIELNWKDYKLEKAKVYEFDEIPKFESSLNKYVLIDKKFSKKKFDSIVANKKYNEIIIKGNPNWSNKKKRKKFEEEYNRQLNNIKKEDQDYFSISNPIFTLNKEFAVIYYYDCCNRVGYLYHFSNNRWEKYLKFYRAVKN